MRNLKRALSLALASVMLLGMMVVGASAKSYPSFTDVDAGDNTEAIAVAEMLGLMIGNDGKFMPDKTVTREEMAGILAKLLLLDTDHFTGVSNFTDVAPNAWCAPAIAACAADGFFAGIGNGQFGLGSEMTVNQVGLLLCKVLGYFQSDADYGENPDLAATLQASKAGLFKGLDRASKDAKITRNQMVQMCVNALQATKVEKKSGTGVTVSGNGFTVSTGASEYEDLKFRCTANTDPYVAMNPDQRTPFTAGDFTVELGEDVYDGKLVKNPTGTDKQDSLGRPATVWQYTVNGKAETVKAAKESVATYVVKNTTEQYKDILDDLNLENATDVYSKGKKDGDSKISSLETAAGNAGDVLEFFADDNGKIEVIVKYTYFAVEIDDVTEIDEDDELYTKYGATEQYTLTGLNGGDFTSMTYVDTLSKDYEKHQAIGAREEGDILVVVEDNSTHELYIYAPAESVVGVMSSSAKDGLSATVEGTKHVAKASSLPDSSKKYEDTYTFYLDPNGTILASELKEEAEAEVRYAYVLESDQVAGGTGILNEADAQAAVKVMYLDGTTEIVPYAVSKKDNKWVFDFEAQKDVEVGSNTFKTTVVAGWYSYTLNSKGEITLKAVGDDYGKKATDLSFTDKNAKMGSTYYADSKTVVTVLNKDGVAETSTGYTDFPGVTESTGLVILAKKGGNIAKEVYVYKEDYKAEGEKVDAAVFIELGDEVKDGVQAVFYADGKKVTYTVSTSEAAKLLTPGTLYDLTLSDGKATVKGLFATTDYTYGDVEAAGDTYIIISSSQTDLASDCKVFKVTKKDDSISVSATSADKLEKGDHVAVFKDGSKAYLIFVYPTEIDQVKKAEGKYKVTYSGNFEVYEEHSKEDTCNKKVNSNSTDVVAGTTLYVRASDSEKANNYQLKSATEGIVLTEVYAGEKSSKAAVYSFVMPDKDLNLNLTAANGD